MTDYSKLTVAKLKEILKERSLPTTGLKAALVARLAEDDLKPSADAEAPEESPAPQDDTATELTIGSDSKPTATQEAQSTNSRDEASSPSPKPEEASADRSTQGGPAEKEEISQVEAADGSQEESIVSAKIHQVPAAQESPPRSNAPEPVRDDEHMDVESPAGGNSPSFSTLLRSEIPVSRSQPIPSKEQPGNTPEDLLRERSTQASVDREEIIEDSRKRKRRSQSPPPSTLDTALKKAKALDGSPRVVMQEDLQTQHLATQETAYSEKEGTLEFRTQERSQEDAMKIETHDVPQDEAEAEPKLEENVVAEEPTEQQAHLPSRPSPTSAKFKSLFETQQNSNTSRGDQGTEMVIDDRDIQPATHPATSALYIRNFMRPLHPGNLKDHLQSIARSHSDADDEDSIIEFYLDPIKTHCLVQFSTVSAASRVRLAMHDRTWPDERTRKALWVDFVPEGKIKKWIEVEQESGGGRGAPQKRWEVVYEREDDEIMAYLQEADSASGRGQTPRGLGADANRNGQRTQPPSRAGPPAPRGDAGKGFKALDDLFKSTGAKPKLYYQPVTQDIASQRLDRLAEGRGGGRSDEMRRFTFEDDVIVDKGPEYGLNYRGGGRGRGGYSRGHAPRGGYRGDSWREGR